MGTLTVPPEPYSHNPYACTGMGSIHDVQTVADRVSVEKAKKLWARGPTWTDDCGKVFITIRDRPSAS